MSDVNRSEFFKPGDRAGFRVGVRNNYKHVKYEGMEAMDATSPYIDVKFSAEKVQDGLRFYWDGDNVSVILLDRHAMNYRLLADPKGDINSALQVEKSIGPFKGYGFLLQGTHAFVNHAVNNCDGMSPCTEVFHQGARYIVGATGIVLEYGFDVNANVTITVTTYAGGNKQLDRVSIFVDRKLINNVQ